MPRTDTETITQTEPTEGKSSSGLNVGLLAKRIGIISITIGTLGYLYLQQPQFVSPNVIPDNYQGKFYSGVFHNPVDIPVMTSDDGFFTSLYKFVTDKAVDGKPISPQPSIKTDLHTLALTDNVIVWMGHSSYFIQMDGLRFLVDPVFSTNASPVPYTNQAFEGSNIYSAEDIPEIDFLLITHDHWDHLDHPTITSLKDKVKQVITPIGVGSYISQWGYNSRQIFEGDWYDAFKTNDIEIHILPAQHFSGRLLKRNKTLWGSFALITPNHKIYLGGDSGYGPHFKQISDQLGEFDVAILEAGQYNQDWANIHMMPEETAQAAADLQAKALMPSHNSKYKLSKHSWYEPLNRILKVSEQYDYRLMTPLIGEAVQIDSQTQTFTSWWEKESEETITAQN